MRAVRQVLGALAIMSALAGQADAAPGEVLATIGDVAEVSVHAEGLEHPWSLAFLPDGRALVTERPGRMRYVSPNGELSEPIAGVPQVDARGQGGLLDVALDPDFAQNGLIYLSYAEAGSGGNGTAVARGRLNGERLEDVDVIFRQLPKKNSSKHFGSRLVFDREGHLFITLGERSSFADEAQNLTGHLGKVVRIKRDGGVPEDNPFVGREGVRPEIWSYGHRNPQGAALRPEDGSLWVIEHGARGGDEINIVRPGRNYGWPVIAYGRHYSGLKIGEGTHKAGMEQPIFYWDPSIAPSGAMFYTGNAFPQWRGNLFVGALKDHLLVRLTLDGDAVLRQDKYLEELSLRIRDVRQGPDDAIYLLTDEDDGAILKVTPLH
jgi:glucose/arabinose dehydrogenase